MNYYLAIDIGASSGRHMLCHLEDGKMILEEIYRFPNGMKNVEGSLCWDIPELFSHIKAGMKKCSEIGKIPVSMGIDTWAVDYVLLDKDDQIIGKTYGYRDSRTEGMDEQVYRQISKQILYAKTGIQKQLFNTIYQLMAVKVQESGNLEKAETMLLIPDYFNFLLTGVKMTEYTNATTTQLVSPATKDWDEYIIERLGYPRRIFTKIEKPGTLVGRLTKEMEEVDEIRDDLKTDAEWIEIGTEVPKLAKEYFLVTGSGKYFRNVILDPEDSICVIELDETGTKYRILWGLVNGGKPTSELPSHLMNHAVKMIASGGKHRVIYHAHTTNTIALTFVLPLTDEAFTRELWEMATECPVVFPSGIGVVGWMVPGGRDIAVATSELMKSYDVAIWAHHGMFCSGEDFDLTFGLMHTVEKSAEILVKTLSMTSEKRQTITPDDFRALAKDFHVELPEKFLYEK